MAADYTTTQLLAQLKLRGMVPESQETYEDDDLLALLDDTIHEHIIPVVLSTRGEYFVTYTDETVGSSTSFNIPTRALGAKLRDVLRISTGGDVYSVPMLEPENLPDYNNISSSGVNAFYLENDKVFIKGNFSTSDTLRLKYFRRPNKLKATTDCALVSSINGNAITCSDVPSAWTTSNTFDVIKGTPHFRSLGDDQTATAVNTTTNIITFTSAPSGIAIGDYICLAGESCIPQIPYDLFSLLINQAAQTIMEDLGDSDGAAIKSKKNEKIERNATMLLTNRVEGENRKVVNRHNFGWKRGNWWGN